MTYAQAGRHATWMRGCTHSPIGDANISTSNSNSGGRFRAMSSAMGSRSAPCHSQVCGKYMCFDFSPARLASVCLFMPEGAQQNSCSAVQVEYLATPMRQLHSPVPLPARPRTRSGTWHETKRARTALSLTLRAHTYVAKSHSFVPSTHHQHCRILTALGCSPPLSSLCPAAARECPFFVPAQAAEIIIGIKSTTLFFWQTDQKCVMVGD